MAKESWSKTGGGVRKGGTSSKNRIKKRALPFQEGKEKNGRVEIRRLRAGKPNLEKKKRGIGKR